MIEIQNGRKTLAPSENCSFSQKAALALIRFYQQAVSPHFPPCCRYQPTCSVYAFEALEKYGFVRGSFLAIKRILRCHPFSRGGYDPL
jgi:putative membrane protein insertion efficiency factor